MLKSYHQKQFNQQQNEFKNTDGAPRLFLINQLTVQTKKLRKL